MSRYSRRVRAAICVLGLIPGGGALAKEDIEYVAEHLPEAAMDNRYATLPIWGDSLDEPGAQAFFGPGAFTAQAAFASTGTGELTSQGPMLSLGLRGQLKQRWSVGGFVFYDSLSLSGGDEVRPLRTRFAVADPLVLPAQSLLSGLDGNAKDYGVGFSVALRRTGNWLGEHRWVAGVLWQKVKLSDYRFNYQVIDGPSAGAMGTIDFDGSYSHFTPFIGLELPRRYGDWTFAPHLLLAQPLPRRGVLGRITGPGFDLRGDTATAGAGKHFGDTSLTLGMDLTYEPWHMSLDLGTTFTQWFLEPVIHKGIDRNLVISAQWRY